MKRVTICFLLLFQFILYSTVSAQTPAITNGLNYLSSSQNADGSWGTDASGTETLPSTVSIIETLQLLNQTGTASYSSAFSWLQLQGLDTTDYLSERIHALTVAGTDESLLLSYLDNLTGAWGGYDDYEANNLDTVLALIAQKKISYSDQNTISYALGFVTETQNPDGGWGFYQGDDSNVYMTAAVLNTLSQFKAIYNLQTPINSAVAYLLTKQNPDGGFGSSPSTVYETSLAFEALLASGAVGADKASVIQNAINYITSTQLPDGSWNEDPYSTALALRALADVKPNLSVSTSDISFSNPAPSQGETITVTANIRNTGSAQADNVVVRFYEGDPSMGGILIGETTILTIPVSGSAQVYISYTIPAASSKVIFAIVDPLNAIDELDETDNTASKNLTVATLPDLSITSSDIALAPSAPKANEAVTITATIRNLGETGANSVMVDVYDGDPASGGVNIGTTTIQSIGPGGMATIQLANTFTTGSHTIYVIVDRANSIVEGDKTNNVATKTIQVGGGTIDLAVTRSDLTFSPQYPVDGNIITINAAVHNLGDGEAKNVLVRFYLGDPDAGGTRIGTDVTIPSLSAGGTIPVSTPWNSTGKNGNITIFVKVDPLDAIAESNEGNNKAFIILRIAAVSFP